MMRLLEGRARRPPRLSEAVRRRAAPPTAVAAHSGVASRAWEAEEGRARGSRPAAAPAAAAAQRLADVVGAADDGAPATLAGAAESEEEELALQATLRQYFGFESFRHRQLDVLKAVLDGQDVCVYWATGRGKSLCYQLPAVHLNCTVIVVSPLIALMQDQVANFNERFSGMPTQFRACLLGSAQHDPAVEEDALAGKYHLLYLTPEKLTSSYMLDSLHGLYDSGQLGMLAVDEAHCITEWGDDFRPVYKDLWYFREEFPDIPIMALTAITTPIVQSEVEEFLRLSYPFISQSSIDRPNLQIVRTGKTERVLDLKRVAEDIAAAEGSTIVYVPTRREADDVASALSARLRRHDLFAYSYHGGKKPSERKRVQKHFLSGRAQVIVATVAFALGIDKPDIRRVVHYGAPRSVEEYFQEIGRAGRDGKPAVCELITSASDFDRRLCAEDEQDWKLDSAEALQDYTSSCTCARRWMLEYFQEEPPFEGGCGTCDVCRQGGAERADPSDPLGKVARVILAAVHAGGDLHLSAAQLLHVIRGTWKEKRSSPSAAAIRRAMPALKAQAAGCCTTPADFKALARALIPVLCEQRLLQRHRIRYGEWPIVRLSYGYSLAALGHAVHSGDRPLDLCVPPAVLALLSRGNEADAVDLEVEDVESLKGEALKEALEARGLATRGRKAEKQDRLRAALIPGMAPEGCLHRIQQSMQSLDVDLLRRAAQLSPEEWAAKLASF